jgi:hypothetical protein
LAKLPAGHAAVHVFRRAFHSGQLAMRASTGLSSLFEKVLPTRPRWNQSHLWAVFLAMVDMDRVLYD